MNQLYFLEIIAMARKVVTEERKKEIVMGLYTCLTQKSYRDTTIKDIASNTGFTYGIIHYHFKNKEEILLNLIDQMLSELTNQFLINIKDRLNVLTTDELTEEIIHYISEKITKNREINLVFVEIWSLAMYNIKIRNKLKDMYQKWIDLIVSNTTSNSSDKSEAIPKAISLLAIHEGLSLFSVLLDMKTFKDIDIVETFKKVISD
jgi:AcrR family transcriptional regulator